MSYMDIIEKEGIVPVVAINDAKNAIPTANALKAGGIDVMEITFRTKAAEESIMRVSKSCPDVLVGAGTVVTLDQCKRAVKSGAKFIVSPGFDEEIAKWCIDNEIDFLPGCVTPSEIMAAGKMGLKILKFFPAGIYGGLSALKALSAPFGDVKFIPTGGVNENNIGEYEAASCVFAIGGTWICKSSDIDNGEFKKITDLTAAARTAALGYQILHIGMNTSGEEESLSICRDFERAFGFSTRPDETANFAGSCIEAMRGLGRGTKGHIAILTNNIIMAMADVERKGFKINPEAVKKVNGKTVLAYLDKEFGGFAVHLQQK